MLNSFNMIMQPKGWYMWSKRDNNGIVKTQKLTKPKLMLLFSMWIVLISLYSELVLSPLGGNTPFIDAITTISSITAMILCVFFIVFLSQNK